MIFLETMGFADLSMDTWVDYLLKHLQNVCIVDKIGTHGGQWLQQWWQVVAWLGGNFGKWGVIYDFLLKFMEFL